MKDSVAYHTFQRMEQEKTIYVGLSPSLATSSFRQVNHQKCIQSLESYTGSGNRICSIAISPFAKSYVWTWKCNNIQNENNKISQLCLNKIW